jgi:hypothetical protein
MARRKLTPIVTPNTLESVIQYTLISSILDRICEMTKKPLEYRRDDIQTHHYQPNGPVKTNVCMLDLNAKFELTTTSIHEPKMFPNMCYFVH